MNLTMFIRTTVKYFDTKIYAIIQQASYMIRSFLLTMKEVLDKEKEKHNTNYDMDVSNMY